MRQKIMATIIVLGISITAASLTRPQVGPELVVEPERVYVLQGHETEDVVVRLKNTGDSPLKIKAVEKSCSCVSGVLSGRVAEPGSFCELTVSSSGVSDGSLFIMSNAPNRPEMAKQSDVPTATVSVTSSSAVGVPNSAPARMFSMNDPGMAKVCLTRYTDVNAATASTKWCSTTLSQAE